MGSNNDSTESISAKSKRIFFKYWWILLILIPFIVTIYVRLQPMALVPLENSASANVLGYYKQQAATEINQKYPNVAQQKRDELINQKLDELKLQPDIEEQIKKNKDEIAARFSYKSGDKYYVYLGDIDSYYWLRQSRNILEKGTQCDVIEDGKCYDSYTTAPILREKTIDYYPVIIVWNYKILKIFDKDMSLMQASFLTPLILSLILTIPLFLVLRKLAGNFAAVVGTILVNTNPFVLTRTLGSDSDITNLLFQAIFIWLAVETFYAQKNISKYIWAFFTGASLCLYSFFWTGWWYLLDLFIFALIINALYHAAKKWFNNNKSLKLSELFPHLKVLAIVFAIFFGTVLLFNLAQGPSKIADFTISQFSIFRFKAASNTNYWPNVLTTVAEFNGMPISQVIASMGTMYKIPLFLMAMLGLILIIFPNIKFITKNFLYFCAFIAYYLTAYYYIKSANSGILAFVFLIPIIIGLYLHVRTKEEETFYPDSVLLLSVLICLVIYFTTIGVRFMFLMSIPIAIFVSIFIIRSSTIIFSLIRKTLSIPKIYSTAALFIITLFVVYPAAQSGTLASQGYMPHVTAEWDQTLTKIKNESKPDAIINSWWDFGHWFKYIADRRVTLDGSSQNSPQLHWLGKLLLTSDEKTSIGILRMLDCGGNNAFDELDKVIKDTPHSIDILNNIIVQSKDDAVKTLIEHGLDKEQIDDVLKNTHCEPPEDFLITSEDMIGKAGVWAHFGSWDFRKAYLSENVNKIPDQQIISKFEKDYKISKEQTAEWLKELRSLKTDEEINYWIASWPSYYSGFSACSNIDNSTICQLRQNKNVISIKIDFENKQAIIIDGSQRMPKTIAFIENGKFDYIDNSDKKGIFPLGVVVQRSGDSISAMYMSPELTGSMFTRLFFFNGIGLTQFGKFDDTRTAYNDRVITWKVKW